MNTTENKRLLWDLTNHMYKNWMSRESIIRMFEETISEVDKSEGTLIEKNKQFISIYVERVTSLQPADASGRASMFEARLKDRFPANPSKKVSFEDDIIEIKSDETPLHVVVARLQEEVKQLKAEVERLKK